jgi:hypothetical protein
MSQIATRSAAKRRMSALAVGAVVVALCVLSVGTEAAERADASRYPYDPVCRWGRIANGRGMLVRCISKDEAEALRRKSPAAGSAASQQPGSRSATSTQETAPSPGAARPRIGVTVGPVLVQSGKLPAAERKLRAAEDRYAKCVEQHGGLTRTQGEVRVRFLVRGRGRAEGVGVSKRRSVSAEAARCIANVVDRRYVGLPDAEIVAATLVVKLRQLQQ